MAYDDSHDSMSVSAGRDDNSNGRGTGPEGNGDGGNNSSVNSKYDPGAISHLTEETEDGLIMYMTVTNVTFIDTAKKSKKNTFFEPSGGKGNTSNSGNNVSGTTKIEHKWSSLPKELNVEVEKYEYKVSLDDKGNSINVVKTKDRPLTSVEILQQAVAKSKGKKPEDIYPNYTVGKGEKERESKAKAEAQKQWQSLPPNHRKFEVVIEGYQYLISIDNFGNIVSSKKTKDRPLTSVEILQQAVAKSKGKKPEDMYPDYTVGKGDEARLLQAAQVAQNVFSSYPSNAISITTDFYKALSDKFGEKLSLEAKELAKQAKGKTIRNASEAIRAFEKYKGNVNKKLGVADRNAIAKALESLDKEMMAKQLQRFSKLLGVTSSVMEWSDLAKGIAKGVRTGDWNDAFISGEKIVAGKIATALIVFAFSAISVTPMGIIGTAIILTITSALITDERLKAMNDYLMSI